LNENWPFSDPENLAVITIKQIVQGGEPILHVVHDEDDEGWQFLGASDASEEDAMVVGLRKMVRLDPSVRELADLPLGWRAWRSSRGEPWQRGQV
jgi:hypothetical protein